MAFHWQHPCQERRGVLQPLLLTHTYWKLVLREKLIIGLAKKFIWVKVHFP